MTTIRLGVVESLDYLPVIEAFGSEENRFGVELIKDKPIELYRKFFAGELDIAPLPSIEYARHYQECVILPDLSISADGPAAHILLLSKVPVHQLHGRTICVPVSAITSVVLLKILIDHYYEMNVKYITGSGSLTEMLKHADAVLLFGPRAIAGQKEVPGLHSLDLAATWKEFTTEPMVYALWVARREFALQYPVQVDFISKALLACKNLAVKNMPRLIEKARNRYQLEPDVIEKYFGGLKLEFDQAYRKALLRYYAHAQICGLIPPKVTLKVWGEDPL